MPPTDRFVVQFAAEPAQDPVPYGRWADRLRHEFLGAVLRIEDGDSADLGEPGDLLYYPDRTWNGRTFVPVTASTSSDREIYGYVSYIRSAEEGGEPAGFHAVADWTEETAARHPEWKIDLCDEVIGIWHGEEGKEAAMTLVWGRPMVRGGAIATAELADLAVDQCVFLEDRFTLIAADDYRGDTLDIKLFDRNGRELAVESLYADDGEDDGDADDADVDGADQPGAGEDAVDRPGAGA